MTTSNERVYDLARDALAEQERSVDQLRGRLAPVLAAAAVVASLLAKSAFAKTHPDGVVEWVAVVCAIAALLVLAGAASVVLAPRSIAFSLDAEEVYEELGALPTADEFHLAVALSLRDQQAANEKVVRAVRRAFIVVLVALVIEAAGLGLAAALAS